MQRVTSLLTLLSVGVAAMSSCGSTPPTDASGSATQAGSSASTAPSTPRISPTSTSSTGGSSSTTPTRTPPPSTTGTATAGTSAVTAAAGHSSPSTTNGGTGGTTSAPSNASAGTHAAAGSGGSGTTAAAGSTAPPATGGSSITGKLGALGDVKPIMNGYATTNGLETLIYLSSAPLTCAQMMTQGQKWLAKLPAASQVIEIVVGQPASVKMYPIGSPASLGGGEVNYAEGSKSSSTEVTGRTGTVNITMAMAKGVHEGKIDVSAPFTASGTFHAEWCEGGTEY